MSELIPRARLDLSPRLPVSRRLPRDVQAAVDHAVGVGLVGAARVQAAAYVTHQAVVHHSVLKAVVDRQAARDPVAADVYDGFLRDFEAAASVIVRQQAL